MPERTSVATRRRFVRWLVVVSSVWTLLHAYIGYRLLAGAALRGVALGAACSGISLLAIAPFVALLAGRSTRLPFRGFIQAAGFTAMGLSSLLIVFVLAGDILHVRGFGLRAAVVSGVVVGASLLVMLVGAILARRPRVVEVEVPIANLPPELDGFRIVQLSDLHVGPTIRRPFVEAVVERANRLRPDLIAFTGDVADGQVPELRDAVAPLARLEAPHGKFYVTGNHEYYWDAPGWTRELQRLGFSVLNNEHRLVRQGSARVLVAGVPDQASDPTAAARGAPASDVKLLLAHQPQRAFAAQAAGYDLQLSGHTHGGQYFPFNLLVRLFQPFVAGLHRLDSRSNGGGPRKEKAPGLGGNGSERDDAMWLYVSRGTGYWGPPLRLGAPSEITLLRLVKVT